MGVSRKIQPIAVTPPIRVLVMLSSPVDYPALDVEAEWTKLTSALADLLASGQIAIERLDDATLTALQKRLRRSQYHIFHFIGHGEFDQTLQEGVLLLEREQQRGHRVGSQYLGMLLHDHESLRVAVLNACEGARSSRQDPFAGSAQTLVQQGIPAVIAMQFEIADDVAGTFAHEFYGALADSYPIDAAVTEARKAIFAAGFEVEWATPVLYLRAPDGRIFEVDHAVAAPKDVRAAAAPGSAVASPAAAAPQPLTQHERAALLLRSAGTALASGDYVVALEHLQQARSLGASARALGELTAMAEEQRAVADTRAHRRAEFREHLDRAGSLIAGKRFTAALQQVAEALRLNPGDREAQALRSQLDRELAAGELKTPRPSAVRPQAEPHARGVANDESDLRDE